MRIKSFPFLTFNFVVCVCLSMGCSERRQDAFIETSLELVGQPVGGTLTAHTLAPDIVEVTVPTLNLDTLNSIAEKMAVALHDRQMNRGLSISFLRREGTKLFFGNVDLGQVYLTSSDSGLMILEEVSNLQASRVTLGVNLTWNSSPDATAYLIYRDGLLHKEVTQPGWLDDLDPFVDRELFVTFEDEVEYFVFAIRGDHQISPPSMRVRVPL